MKKADIVIIFSSLMLALAPVAGMIYTFYLLDRGVRIVPDFMNRIELYCMCIIGVIVALALVRVTKLMFRGRQ